MAVAALLADAKDVLKIKTAKENFFVIGMQGFEHLGALFEYSVDLVGALEGGLLAGLKGGEPPHVDLHDLVGTEACVTMDWGEHTLVLTDALSQHDERPSGNPISWSNQMKEEATMTDWEHRQEVRSVKATVLDRDYLAPSTEIKADKSAADPIGTKVGKMEWFEY